MVETGDTVFDFEAETLAGPLEEQPKKLADYRGKVLLIVNTASQCGFTPQYAGLEKLYGSYKDRGLLVLGFPCNQFGAQEPGSAGEIGAFCEKNYGVSFPMFAKIDVNGPNAHPLYRYLKKAKPGLLGPIGGGSIKWNFTKFLVDRNGHVVSRYAPSTKPESLAGDIDKLLNARER
jgi:glutathione peroxidase